MLGLLGALLGWFVGSVLRVRRAHVLSAMRGAGIGDPERTANAMYGSLGRSLCELLFGALDRRARGDRVTFDTTLFEALDSRGAVIATAHTGNWDLVACEAAARVRLSVVTKHLSLRMLDRFWQSLRAKRGVRLLSAGQAARGALAALGRGEVVAMLIDQAPERERATIVAPFLGQLARVDLAPALAALRARVPLIVAFSRRCPNGRQACQLLTVIQPPTRPNRGWAEQAMRRATAELDAFVRLYPEQWLWMHRRWKDAPSRLEAPSSSRARVAQSPMGSA
jgi:KDO2-lipid IV(A) lauroyltransferase